LSDDEEEEEFRQKAGGVVNENETVAQGEKQEQEQGTDLAKSALQKLADQDRTQLVSDTVSSDSKSLSGDASKVAPAVAAEQEEEFNMDALLASMNKKTKKKK
jgi:hypothetical protein